MFTIDAVINRAAALLITSHDYVRANGHSPLRVILSYGDRSNEKLMFHLPILPDQWMRRLCFAF
jgi:hypothetical protein